MKKRMFLSPPHMGGMEQELVNEAFASNYIAPVGPMVNRFEAMFSEYTGIDHCLALSSGTGAMHLALRCLLKERQKRSSRRPVVIASTLTFIGSVTPAVFENCDIIFVDSDSETWNMDPRLLIQALDQCAEMDENVLAVVPTDIYGQCCDVPAIRGICEQYAVPLVCDSAEAVGAWYHDANHNSADCLRHAGYGATASVYSFNGNKIITTSGGGMLASTNPDLIAQAKKLSTQARENAAHYQHVEIGYNYRLSNILAAIGCGQMMVLDERVKQRQKINQRYKDQLADLPGVTFMPDSSHNKPTNWLTCLLIDESLFGSSPEAIWNKLEINNIEARPVWKPMHLQPVFQGYRRVGGAVSEMLFHCGLCLPSGSAMTEEDVDRVSAIIRRMCPGDESV